MLSWMCVPFAWLCLEGIRHNERASTSLREKLGLSFTPGIVMWETRRMNGAINRLGDYARFDDLNRTLHESIHCFLDAWYVVGAVVFAIIQILLFFLLLSGAITSIYRALTSNTMAEVADAAVIRPVVPGVNMPMTDFPLVAFTLVVTLSFHELGHAFAAATERVKTEGVGLFFALVMPGAFVRLEEGLLPQLPPRAQLKVYCAGAWHNLILALFALLASKSLPTLFYPLYEAQPTIKSNHRQLFEHHHHHHHGQDIRYYRHIKHDGLALELQPFSPFYDLLGKPDDSLVALDDTFISSFDSLIDVISKIDARASFATPSSLFQLSEPSPQHGDNHTQHAVPQNKKMEVVQLQGWCVPPKEDNSPTQYQPSLNTEECFIVGSAEVGFSGGDHGEGEGSIDHTYSTSDTDVFVRVCQRTTSLIENAKHFASQVHEEYVNRQRETSERPALCKHCKRLPVFTCSRSLDCPRVKPNRNNAAGERGSCARALLSEGESLVTVHLSSGKSLAWRGDVVLDGLQLALTPAAMRLRPYVSSYIHSAAAYLSTTFASDGLWNGDQLVLWLVRLPSRILAFFNMLSQVSISIALLNILPIYYLDGHLASVQFIRLWLLSAPPPPPPPSRRSHHSHSEDIETPLSLRNISGNLSRTSSGNRPLSPQVTRFDDPELEQLYRDRYHDWNALHKRQTRYTWALLGTGSVLVIINLALGGIAAFAYL